jgi:hypothetical protein
VSLNAKGPEGAEGEAELKRSRFADFLNVYLSLVGTSDVLFPAESGKYVQLERVGSSDCFTAKPNIVARTEHKAVRLSSNAWRSRDNYLIESPDVFYGSIRSKLVEPAGWAGERGQRME